MGSEETAESDIWEIEAGDRNDNPEVMQVQGSRIDGREYRDGSHTHIGLDTAEVFSSDNNRIS